MYQSFINLLSEAGYKKFMSEIGPVYLLEDGENRQIVFVTYHKNQIQEPVYLLDYKDSLLEIGETIFPGKESEILCIMIVDDGLLLENQIEDNPYFSVWIQDEVSGKLYMSKGSEEKFRQLWHLIQVLSESAKEEMEQIESSEKNQWQELKDFFTPINLGLIISNIIIFLLGKYVYTDIMEKGVMEWVSVISNHEYYRFLTSIFLHFDWEHLLNNMIVLFLSGSFVERYLGSVKYLMSYLICGLSGSMLSFYFQIGGQTTVWSAGASGAIYGVLGILAVLLIKKREALEGVQGPGIFILVIGSIFQSYQTIGTDNWAHLGGLVSGVILGILLKKKQKAEK